MNRRTFLCGLLGTVAVPIAVGAQQSGNVGRVGILWMTSPEVSRHERAAFQQGLHEVGWVEGENVAIESRYAEGNADRLPALATELIALKVDVVVAATGLAIQAAKDASPRTPIVMAASGDPVKDGFVASLGRPGGSITGLTFIPGPEIAAKQLQLLKEVLPGASRVAVLANSTNPWHATGLTETRRAAQSLGVTLEILQVRHPDDIDRAFATVTRTGVSALQVFNDAMFFGQRARIAELAAAHRLPAIYGGRPHVEAGGLIGYGASLPDSFRRSAGFVGKILGGASPAELPVERPSKFEVVISLKAAKTLGLTIPPSLLQRADQVIE